MISAKWWNRKPYTFFSHWDTNSILHRQVPIVRPEVSQEALVPQLSMKPAASEQVLKFVALAKSFCLAHKPHSKGNCQLRLSLERGRRNWNILTLWEAVWHTFLSCMNLGPTERHQKGHKGQRHWLVPAWLSLATAPLFGSVQSPAQLGALTDLWTLNAWMPLRTTTTETSAWAAVESLQHCTQTGWGVRYFRPLGK